MSTIMKNKYIELLCDSQVDKMQLLRHMFSNNNYDELNKIADRAPSTFTGLLSLSFLRRNSYQSLHGRGFLLSKPYEEYVGILAFIFSRNKKIINQYLLFREKYDTAFLLGKYDEAEAYLVSIKKISYSIWTLEQDIKLERLKSGLSACTQLYNKLYKESGNIYSYMAYLFYLSSSTEYSFEAEIDLNYENLKNTLDEDTFGYIVAHCMPFKPFSFADWVKFDLRSSLLDLYDNFMFALNVANEGLIKNKEFQKNVLLINDVIEDKRLHSFLYKQRLAPFEGSEAIVIREKLIKDYYSADYESFIAEYPKYGDEYPWDTSLLDLYVKSLVIMGAKCPKSIGENTPIFDKLLVYYYKYLTKENNNQPLYYRNIMTICHSCYSIYGISHFWNIVKGYESKSILHILDDFSQYSYGRNIRQYCVKLTFNRL